MPTSAVEPSCFCRTCGYDLRASGPAARCPECGKPFDPDNSKTYARRPPRGPWWKWTKRTLLLLLTLAILLGGPWGWLYWEWKEEQTAFGALAGKTGNTEFTPLGGDIGQRIRGYLGSQGVVLDRLTRLCVETETPAELAQVWKFKHLHDLTLHYSPVTDADLPQLRSLKHLEHLSLPGAPITDAGLVHLEGLTGLTHLKLEHTNVTDAGVKKLQAALPATTIDW